MYLGHILYLISQRLCTFRALKLCPTFKDEEISHKCLNFCFFKKNLAISGWHLHMAIIRWSEWCSHWMGPVLSSTPHPSCTFVRLLGLWEQFRLWLQAVPCAVSYTELWFSCCSLSNDLCFTGCFPRHSIITLRPRLVSYHNNGS